MKKFTKLMSLTASLCVMLSSMPYCTSAYDYQCNFTINEILDSETKPKITVESECISIEEAKANPTRTISISVNGADLKYAITGFHIYYDSRLTISLNKFGSPKVTSGSAWEYLTTDTPMFDPTAAEQGMSGIFICSAHKSDYGRDGVMCTIEFQLPSDVASGDVFPIDIIYKSVPSAEDLFTNAKNDQTGQLMQAYAFTYGIYNGVTSKFVPEKEDLQRCENLYDIDSSYDGYIAIEDSVNITTTATSTATTTTTRPTTTTVKTTSTATSTKQTTITTSTTTTANTATQSLIIVPSEVNMAVGDTNNLAIAGADDLSQVMWTSSNTLVATVDKNGKVTAKNIGNAEIYAVYNGIIASCNITVTDKNIIYGDANGDGKVNMSDATSIIQHIGNKDLYGLKGTALVNADTNGDGQVTTADALIIQEVVSGIYKAEDLPLKNS